MAGAYCFIGNGDGAHRFWVRLAEAWLGDTRA